MSPIRAEDLPPDVRKHFGLNPTPKRTKPSRAGTSETEPCPGHCGCSQPFTRYTDRLRHAQTTGCRHWRIDLPNTRKPAA